MGEQPKKHIISHTKTVSVEQYEEGTRQASTSPITTPEGQVACDYMDIPLFQRLERERQSIAASRARIAASRAEDCPVAGPSVIPRPPATAARDAGAAPHCGPGQKSAAKALPALTAAEMDEIPIFQFVKQMMQKSEAEKARRRQGDDEQRHCSASPTRTVAAAAPSDPCTPPSEQMARRPPRRPTRECRPRERNQRDPSPVARPDIMHSPRQILTDEGTEAAQMDPCTPPSEPMAMRPPRRPTREGRTGVRTHCDTSPVARPDIEHVPRQVMSSDEFRKQCDRLLAQWGGYFTSPQSIAGRSHPQSSPSMPSSPGSDGYWATSPEEGVCSAESNMSSNWSTTRSSPPLSSLESGISTPGLTPQDMSPAPEMFPSAFHATETNVVLPNFQTILLIIDYLATNFCEDRRQRLDQINCLVTQLTSKQGNELQDSLLTLRDLVKRRGQMLPYLYQYFRELSDELKDIHKRATDRHNPVPNLCKLSELANKELDPSLTQQNYLNIVNDMRLFASWAYLRCSHEESTNDELQNYIEDLMCCPERLRDFILFFNDLYEECSGAIDTILENLRARQLQIDQFLKHWKKGGEVLNQPAPDDMARRYIQLPHLDSPELEAGVPPGGPMTGTKDEPLGPPPPPPGYQPLLRLPGPLEQKPPPCSPRPTTRQPSPKSCPPTSGPAAAWDVAGPSGLQSGRFTNAPIPGPAVRAAYTSSSSSDSSPWSPGYQRYAPADPRLVEELRGRISQMCIPAEEENVNISPDSGRDFC